MDLMCFDKTIVKEINKVQKYLYTIDYETIDYEYAKAFYEERVAPPIGACSSIRSGNWYGRNFDWHYNDKAYFIVRTAAAQGRYASIGISGSLPTITDDSVEERKLSELYKIVPFATVDGINEKGVCCNINVVPNGDYGITTGTKPGAERICARMLPRYILDNFATADEAITAIQELSIYAPHGDISDTELHVMIADSTKTYIVEFVHNETVVLDVTNTTPYMTNFYLSGATVDDSGHVDISSVTPRAAGIERWNIMADSASTANSLVNMTTLMTSINYSNAYSLDNNPLWISEFVDGEEYKLTDDPDKFIPVIEYGANLWEHRTRTKDEVWQTVHTSIYDLQNKKLYLITQEESASTQKKYNINHYYTSEEIDALIG